MATTTSMIGLPASVSYGKYNCSNGPLPLTTTFTPPTSCFDYWTPVYSVSESGVGTVVSLIQNMTRAECVPSLWAICSSCGLPISPGICPSGWPAASTGISNGVTTHYCCPSGAANYTSDYISFTSRCLGYFSSGLMNFTYSSTHLEESYAYPTAATAGSFLTPTASKSWSTAFEVRQTIYVDFGTLGADPIIVEFKENELSTSVTLASSPSSAISSRLAPSQIFSTTSISSTTPSPPSERRGLSSGAKAGVGIGVAVGVCSIIGFGLLIYRSRKRNASRSGSMTRPERSESSDEPMEPEEPSNDATTVSELPASSGQELDGNHPTT